MLVENMKGKYQYIRPGRRWKYNIKMDLKKVECELMVWIHLPQDRVQ
jgi:hypothetical protein